MAELTLALAASRTSNNCTHSPIAHSPPPQHLRPLYSQPQCVPLLLAASRTLPSAHCEPLRPTRDHRHDHQSPRAQPLTRNAACPTSRVSTARTMSLRGRDSTRTTTVLGSGRRWVDTQACAEEQRHWRHWDIAHENRTHDQEQQADNNRTTGPSRQNHALPLLRHFDRYQQRYVLESTHKRRAPATDTSTATMYMMFRMVFGHKTWY